MQKVKCINCKNKSTYGQYAMTGLKCQAGHPLVSNVLKPRICKDYKDKEGGK